MERDAELEAHLSRIAREWVSTVLLLGAFLFLLLGGMDFLTVPEQAPRFFRYRIGIALILFVLFALNRLRTSKYYQYFIVTAATTASAVMIELMVLAFGGQRSTYYAGFNLVVICALGFIPINLALSAVLLLVIYSVYLLPILLTEQIADPVFISNNFFMVGTFIIALAWRAQNQKLIITEFRLRRDLAREREKLEQLVMERTTELRQSEHWHRSLFENATDGILVLDRNGIIVNANDRACAMHGFARDALIGTFAGLLEVDGGKERFAERMRALAGGAPLEYEAEHYRKDGTRMALEVSAKAITMGEHLYVQAFFRDITEKKKIQEHLFQSQKLDSIGTLAGGIAHDFNNILTAILGYTELVRKASADNENVLNKLAVIERAARTAGRMISQLLGFARKSELEIVPLNVNDVVQDTVRLLERVLDKRIALDLKLADIVPSIAGDITQMEQVLMNLIVNARDAMPQGGTITIRTRTVDATPGAAGVPPYVVPGSYVVLEVADTGMGIPEEVQGRIFEPFFTTKERGKGTGLGLAMVYGVVTGHKGYVSVQSAPGRGTTFTLFFPAAARAAAVRDFRTSTWVRGTETILVVDDDEAVLGYVRESLEMNGYRVIATTSPMSAIDAFKQRQKEIALVVTDVVMPLMDGGELVRRLREIQPAVKVITISGFSRYHDDGGGVAPSAFLQKPFETSYLLNTVRRAIDAERAAP